MTREELQHLIDVIVGELTAAAPRPEERCPCHAVLDDCCPDRLRGVLDAGATRVGLYAAGGAPDSVASMIDHTLLKPDATRANIGELCREAAQFKFATVWIHPTWVALSAKLLEGSGVRVCSVVGFPLGATAADVALMRRVVGAEMGVKAAGGVRDLEGMKAMIAAGATRVGASAGVKIVQQARGEQTSTTVTGY